MNLNISKNASKAIDKLKSNGFSAYIVGGCVRDLMMNKIPHDWDICTNASPQEILATFSQFKVIETGISHGTITVILDNTPLEITTFRIDGSYSDNRHPEKVLFVSDLMADLSRRDFTINAMAYNESEGLIDSLGSIQDLNNKIIRCVGNADTRFNEDALRILRAIRFSSQLGFRIEENTHISILENRELLKNISEERIASELNKLLLGDNVFEVLRIYRDVIAVFIPELIPTFDFKQNNIHHCYSVYDHIIKSVENSPKNLIVRLSMLFHDIAKPQTCYTDESGKIHFKGHQLPGAEIAEKILIRLKYDGSTIRLVKQLVSEHDNRYPAEKKTIKRYLNKYGYDFFVMQNQIRRADTLAQSMYHREKKINQIHEVEFIGKKILKQDECFKLSDLAINGNDLIKIGILPGENMGRLLNEILELVISEQIENDKQKILDYIKNCM